MAETFISVTPSKPGAATPTIIYTTPGATTSLVLSLVCANNSGSGGAVDQVTVKKIASGGVAGDSDVELVSELDVQNQESFFFAEKVVLATGEAIAVESANGDVVFTLSVLERT